MSASFTHCQRCGRLNIAEAQCTCRPATAYACDCTYSGNRQVLGPLCRERMSLAWEKAVEGQR